MAMVVSTNLRPDIHLGKEDCFVFCMVSSKYDAVYEGLSRAANELLVVCFWILIVIFGSNNHSTFCISISSKEIFLLLQSLFTNQRSNNNVQNVIFFLLSTRIIDDDINIRRHIRCSIKLLFRKRVLIDVTTY